MREFVSVSVHVSGLVAVAVADEAAGLYIIEEEGDSHKKRSPTR